MLLTSPQAGFRAELVEVICFHSAIGPAHISGGRRSESRMIADVLPSSATETIVPQPLALIFSGLCQRVSILPPARSTVATPLSPSTSSPKRIFDPPAVQASQLAEAFISAVRFLAFPPEAGTTKIS